MTDRDRPPTATRVTTMQWLCLRNLDRHEGNVKAAAHATVGRNGRAITTWTLGYHLREFARREGVESVWRLALIHSDRLAAENGWAKRKRCRQPDVAPGQQCLGLVA